MSLQFEKILNDNDLICRFISENELDALIEKKALLRFTKTRIQFKQEEGFAFGNQIQREKDKFLIDSEESVKNDIDSIAAYIEKNERELQIRIEKINKQALSNEDNECPGRKLIRELCSILKIESELEILSKWDHANYGIVLDVTELREKIEDLSCSVNVMSDSDVRYIENICLDSSCLCCFWIKPNHCFSRIQWSLRKGKVAAIQTTVKELKRYLKKINVKNYDENKLFYLCKVKYDNAPNYMYNENDFELPLGMTLVGFIHPDKEIISEMLNNLKYKKESYKKEREMRIIAIRKDLNPILDDNIFLPYDRNVRKKIIVSPKLSSSKRKQIYSKIRNIDSSQPPQKSLFSKFSDMLSFVFRRK